MFCVRPEVGGSLASQTESGCLYVCQGQSFYLPRYIKLQLTTCSRFKHLRPRPDRLIHWLPVQLAYCRVSGECGSLLAFYITLELFSNWFGYFSLSYRLEMEEHWHTRLSYVILNGHFNQINTVFSFFFCNTDTGYTEILAISM